MRVLDPLFGQRDLYVNLTLRELRGKYKRSALGWAWSLLNPLATMAIFSVVFRFFLKVEIPAGDPSGLHVFAFFLLCGLLPWNAASAGITGGMGSLLGNANLINKVFFPRELLVAANTTSVSISLLIELGVLVAALLVAGSMVLPWLPLVALVVVVQALFVYGLALLLSVAAVYFRDIQHLVGIALQLWFYATPIVYPRALAVDALADQPLLRWLYEANPMLRFVAIYRDVLYDLRGPELGDVLAVLAATVVSLAVGLAVFRRLEPRLAEEL
ncbi:MAG: ABC transporter permease [Acidimicrobiia bacterium]